MLWEGKKADEGLKARDIYAILIKKTRWCRNRVAGLKEYGKIEHK